MEPGVYIEIADTTHFYVGKPIKKGSMVFYGKDLGTVTNKPNARLAGIILNDVVNIDLAKHHLNWYKDQVQLGGKVSICKRGYLSIKSIKNSKAGDLLYWSGRNFTVKKYNYLGLQHIQIGYIFRTDKNFSNVYVDLPPMM